MGTPRTPAGLKIIQGRGGGKDAAGREVQVLAADRGKPPIPDIVAGDDAAREEWERITPGLERLNLLKPEDAAILTSYCITWSQYMTLVAKVANEGPTVYVTTRGADGSTTRKPMVNPHYKLMAERQAMLLKFAREFGLTPASESLVVGLSQPPESPAANNANPFAG